MLRKLTISLVTLAILVIPATSQAIPAWSRKFKMPCTSCHFGGSNKLMPAGLKFQRRGDTMASEEVKKELDELNLGNYLSFAGKTRYEAEADVDPSTRFDQEAISIYTGGPLYERFSYFFEFYLHERGKEASSGGGQIDSSTRSKLAEAYLQYTSNPGGDTYNFVRAGQYTPRVIYAASTGGRLSVSRPLLWNDTVGGGNLYTPRDRFYGVTFGGSNKGLFVEGGLTNGGGGNARPNLAEQNNAKDWFLSASQDLDANGSSISAYYYKGFYPVAAVGTSGTTGFVPAYDDSFNRFALMADYVKDDFTLSGAYAVGQNKNFSGTNRSPKAFYLEAGLNVGAADTIFARYDTFDYDLAPKKSGFALGWSKRLSNVGRVVTEYTNYSVSGGATAKKLTIELNWMF